jgi:hypothetical protein
MLPLKPPNQHHHDLQHLLTSNYKFHLVGRDTSKTRAFKPSAAGLTTRVANGFMSVAGTPPIGGPSASADSSVEIDVYGGF